MPHLLRQLVLVSIAVAFVVTSVGWGVVSGRSTFAPLPAGHHERVTVAGLEHEKDHDHDLVGGQCGDDAQDRCSSDHAHDKLAGSCCALACHLAVAAIFEAFTIPRFELAAGATLVIEEREGVDRSRLERPPRISAA